MSDVCTYFSEGKESTKPAVSEDSKNMNHNSTHNERTSIPEHNSVVTEEASTTAAKGKRLKIVEIDCENQNENTEDLNSDSCTGETNKLPDAVQQMESNYRTKESEKIQPVEKPQVENLPELPGLVKKAQAEGTQLFKLGRYAEAVEQFTQAIDILQKGNWHYFRLELNNKCS